MCSVKYGAWYFIVFQKVVVIEDWFKPTSPEPVTSNSGQCCLLSQGTFLAYLLPIPVFSYPTRLYFINRSAVLGMIWCLISTVYIIKSLTHCENLVAGSCDTGWDSMCLMSLAFVSINLKAAAWPWLCLPNQPACQVLEDIKESKCFLKIEVLFLVRLSH